MSKTLLVSDLKEGFMLFGNKGAVWSNKCHIAETCFASTTLCGVPMLSSNHARFEGVKVIGCPECIKHYEAHLATTCS